MITRSDTIGALASALAKVQGNMSPAKKTSDNPFFGSSYADLAAVQEVTRGLLAENGLAVVQLVSTAPNGVNVNTQLLHSSGEFIGSGEWEVQGAGELTRRQAGSREIQGATG